MAEVIDFDAARAARLGRLVPRTKEDKRARFKRVAGRRIAAIVRHIDILGNMGTNRAYYKFDNDDVDKIAKWLHGEIDDLHSKLSEFEFPQAPTRRNDGRPETKGSADSEKEPGS
ncbi:hypothetical protein [Rhizobium sp. Root1220]|uniref:hypothetical protein n=1 Tax=Rhizobium sp. Root1220 TaxID=1736432 RepID=UPI0006FB833A|nr:hypothetical protein [Rhizobium sp. Root1220]KQV68042.1 hypothetical protein ASC90_10285 [Rhizobium sp. Root1220]